MLRTASFYDKDPIIQRTTVKKTKNPQKQSERQKPVPLTEREKPFERKAKDKFYGLFRIQMNNIGN